MNSAICAFSQSPFEVFADFTKAVFFSEQSPNTSLAYSRLRKGFDIIAIIVNNNPTYLTIQK